MGSGHMRHPRGHHSQAGSTHGREADPHYGELVAAACRPWRQPYWMAAVLAAMLGEIGLPGGGIGYGYGSTGSIGNPVRSVGGWRCRKVRTP